MNPTTHKMYTDTDEVLLDSFLQQGEVTKKGKESAVANIIVMKTVKNRNGRRGTSLKPIKVR